METQQNQLNYWVLCGFYLNGSEWIYLLGSKRDDLLKSHLGPQIGAVALGNGLFLFVNLNGLFRVDLTDVSRNRLIVQTCRCQGSGLVWFYSGFCYLSSWFGSNLCLFNVLPAPCSSFFLIWFIFLVSFSFGSFRFYPFIFRSLFLGSSVVVVAAATFLPQFCKSFFFINSFILFVEGFSHTNYFGRTGLF